MVKDIYLDNAATAPVSKEVVKEMERALVTDFGNPSSLHKLGESALGKINEARVVLAKEINANPNEIYFTSGGTESNNLAIKGAALASPKSKNKIIISSIEHPSVKSAAFALKKLGFKVVEIPVDKSGSLDLEKLEKTIDKHTALVSVMHVNNILGFAQDIGLIGEICKRKGVPFHTDAIQSFGKTEIDVRTQEIDMLSVSGHKIGGPKGVGFLYVKDGLDIETLIDGGGQEKGLRSGTENVPGIIGFAKALELMKKIDIKSVNKSLDILEEKLRRLGGNINGKGFGILNVSFLDVESEALVYYLSEKGISVSSGSACDSKKNLDHNILKALGLSKQNREGSIRVSIRMPLSSNEIKFITSEFEKAVKNLSI